MTRRPWPASLKDAGFDVISAYNDLGNLQFKRVIRQFEDAASDADIVVVFYAGHGIEIRGVNYLIPVDATLASDRDADDEAITLDRLLQSVEGAKRLGVVILDACRDNPFAGDEARAHRGAAGGRDARIGDRRAGQPEHPDRLCCKVGDAAEDGIGQAQPVHLRSAEQSVRARARRPSGFRPRARRGAQDHQEQAGALRLRFARRCPPFARCGAGPAAAAQRSGGPDGAGEKNDYALVEKIGTKRAWEVFLTQHPSGFLCRAGPPAHRQAGRAG